MPSIWFSACSPFDNIAGFKVKLGQARHEIYLYEWASFGTKEFPENRNAKSGDIVRIITTDFADRTPAVNVLCTDDSYRQLYSQASLAVVAMHKPLANGDEPYRWASETKIAPWVI